MKKAIKTTVFVVIIAFLIVWATSLFWCEVLTMKHGEAFEQLYLQTNILSKADALKVLNFTDNAAEVYYITDGACGNVMRFEKQNGAWVLESWNTVWSTTGSASGAIWPYWWHFMYSIF